jgi:hypothetical protein
MCVASDSHALKVHDALVAVDGAVVKDVDGRVLTSLLVGPVRASDFFFLILYALFFFHIYIYYMYPVLYEERLKCVCVCVSAIH